MEMVKLDVILVQDPYINKNLKLSSIPPNYRCFSKFNPSKRFYSAAIFVKSTLKADLYFGVSTNECVFVSIYSRRKTFTVVSAYCPPSYKNPSLCLYPTEKVRNISELILGGDLNAKSPLWHITDWKVLTCPSLSDHGHISFNLK